MLIDTHAHLNSEDFEKDLEQVVKNSVEAGVEKIVCASSNVEASRRAIEIARKYPGIVFAACGIHPQETGEVKKLEDLAKNKGVVAIGECGLDYSGPKEGQERRFKEQIELAQKVNLPLIIHSRKATEETLQILDGYKNLQGVFHFYSFGKSKIAKILEMGFFFGIDGNLTYEEGLQNVVKEIPLNRIILETDSPLLAPVPHRGSRNEPKNVKIIATKLSKLKCVSFEEIETITTENVIRLFGI